MLYHHLIPPHGLYNARRDFTGIFDDEYLPAAKPEHFFTDGLSNECLNQLRQEYDEYLAYVDSEFGRILSYMDRIGMLDDTYLIFTSHHGEMFERGIEGHVN